MKQRDMGLGIGLVVLGLIFLFGPMLNLEAFGWPFFVIIPGIVLLFLAFTGRASSAALAVPGSIVTVTGLILLVLNITGHMQAWAYAWALVMAAAGAGSYIYGNLANAASLKRNGRRGVIVGLLLFVVLGLAFELFIFGTFSDVLRWLIPLVLIAAGAWLLFRYNRQQGAPTVRPAPGATGPTPPPPAPPPASGTAVLNEADERKQRPG